MLYIHFVVLTTPEEQIRATRVLVLSFEGPSEVGLRHHHDIVSVHSRQTRIIQAKRCHFVTDQDSVTTSTNYILQSTTTPAPPSVPGFASTAAQKHYIRHQKIDDTPAL